MKSQASMEYLTIVGLILVFLIPIFYYASSTSSTVIIKNEAKDAVKSLSKTVDFVYSLSPGTKSYVWITIPGGVINTSVSNNEVGLTLDYGGISEIFYETKANVSGGFPSAKGTYKIEVEHLDSGIVYIGSRSLSIISTSPSGIISNNMPILTAITNKNSLCKYDEDNLTYETMTNFFDGSGVSHTKEIGPLEPDGNYLYYVRCQSSLETMNSSAVISFTLNTSGIDNDNPTVLLDVPQNNEIRNWPIIRFSYLVNDITSNIAYCVLHLNGILMGGGISNQTISDNSVSENVNESLIVSLYGGNYTWFVSCVDDSFYANTGTSESRFLIVNSTGGGSAFIMSCAGWCGAEGLSGGYCDNNPNVCNNNCGLPNTPSCYAGYEISITYCTGGSQADTCCCTY